MPTLVLDVTVNKNTTLYSAQDIRESDFYGIALNAPNTPDMTDDVIERYIDSAVNYFENELSIKIMKQVVTETADYDSSAMAQWGFLRVKNPIASVILIKGGVNFNKFDIPPSWYVTKVASRPEARLRNIHFVPIDSFLTYLISGSFLIGYYSKDIPNFWEITYCTGFDVVPEYLMYAISMVGMLRLFNIFGDIVLGAGLASFSLSLDGLSQSLATTNSSTNAGFGARVLNYTKELKQAIDDLRATYKPIAISVS
jgi:hypothetical protein